MVGDNPASKVYVKNKKVKLVMKWVLNMKNIF